MMTRKDTALETIKLINFLSYNQLVQANAIATKLENVFRQKVTNDIGRPANWAHDPISPEETPDTPDTPSEDTTEEPEAVPMPKFSASPVTVDQCSPEPSDTSCPPEAPATANPEPTDAPEPEEPTEPEKAPATANPDTPNTEIEGNQYWKAFRQITRMKQFILAGTTKKALETAHELAKLV